jgi:lysophospholipase L1-like esterase
MLTFALHAVAQDRAAWIGTWQSSPAGLPPDTKMEESPSPGPAIVKGTLRYRLRVSQGGQQIRLRFSNEYESGTLIINAASVGIAGDKLDAVPGSLKRVTFNGNSITHIPAGAPALSDPIDLPVQSLADIVVSVYVRDGIAMFACPSGDYPRDQVLVRDFNATELERLQASACLYTIRPIVSAIDVRTDKGIKVVVALGDSITDGSLDPKNGERGWPGALSRRLRDVGVSVVNAGIGGNRLLKSLSNNGAAALARLDRDVLAVPGVSHIVLLEGINDIRYGGPGGMYENSPQVGVQDLIGAYSQIIERAHERGIKVIGATMLPFEGARFYDPAREQVRAAANDWIRNSKRFDAVVDFDAAMRDPAHPGRLRSDYDSGDHIHPSSAGYRQMGDVIDPRIFNR